MCKTHWNAYTAGLARDAKVRKAATEPAAEEAPVPDNVAAGRQGEELAAE